MKRQIFAVVAVVLLVKTIGVVHAQSVNLFANPSVETVSLTDTTKPASWGTGKWGNHTRVFSYPVAGYDGSKAVRILVTAYTDGDAKWFPNDVAVTPNTTYTFTHAYQSDVTTSIDIRYTSTEGVVTYVLLAPSVPASSAWKTDSYTFKTPANVASMTVMHIIESNGTLTTDMYSLSTSAGTVDPSPTPAPVPSPTPVPTTGNLILNPSFESRTTTGDVLPLNWAKSIWGINNGKHTYPVAGIDGASAARVEFTARTDGDIKWKSNSITNVTGKRYRYTQQYKANVPTYVDVEYTHQDGSRTYDDIGQLIEASPTWKSFQADFEVPQDVVSIRMLPILNKVGWLEVDAVSLIERPGVAQNLGTITLAFDDGFKSVYQKAIPILNARGIRSSQYIISDTLTSGSSLYINKQDMLAMASQGHEIGSHTRTHPHLTELTQSQLRDEIITSRNNLLALGVTPVSTFVYPYGEYNDSIKQIVRDAGYIGARSVNLGFNNKDTDKYALFDKHVESNIPASSVKQWIDQANANKTWLILELHEQIDNCGTNLYCNTPATLTEIADYIKQSGIQVVTMKEGIEKMNK